MAVKQKIGWFQTKVMAHVHWWYFSSNPMRQTTIIWMLNQTQVIQHFICQHSTTWWSDWKLVRKEVGLGTWHGNYYCQLTRISHARWTLHTLQKRAVYQCSVAHFFKHLPEQSVWRPKFIRTWCPDDAKPAGHQTCRKQNLWLWKNMRTWSSHHWQLVLEQLL